MKGFIGFLVFMYTVFGVADYVSVRRSGTVQLCTNYFSNANLAIILLSPGVANACLDKFPETMKEMK